jgi:hypothetical protein
MDCYHFRTFWWPKNQMAHCDIQYTESPLILTSTTIQIHTNIHCKNMHCWLHLLPMPRQYVTQNVWVMKPNIQKNIQREWVECHSLQQSHKYKTQKNCRNRLIRVASLLFQQSTSSKISKLLGIFNIIICLWLYMGFGLVTGFNEHLQIITTKNYSTLTNSTTQLLTMAHTKSSISSVSSTVTAR